MQPRSAALWLLVALALGAFVYWSEREGGGPDLAGEGASLFGDVAAGEIEWIRLVPGAESDAPEIIARRAATGWRIEAPLRARADDVTLDGMASTLAQLESERTLDGAQAPAVYGLGEDAPRVLFGREGEAEGRTDARGLRLGNPAPVGASSYVARIDRPEEIHVVPTWRVRSLARDLAALRDRRVLPLDTNAVETIALRWPGGGVTLVREEEVEGRGASGDDMSDDTRDEAGDDVGGERGDERGAGFRMLAPHSAEADEGTIANLLSDLSFLRAEDFVDAPGEAERRELESPAFEALLTLEGGAAARTRERFALGDTVDGEGRRLAQGLGGALFRVRADLLDGFPRRVGAYRYKQLASFEPGAAREVEIRFAGAEAPLVLRRAAGARFALASDPTKTLEGFGAILSELARWNASDIDAGPAGPARLAALSLRPPKLAIEVRGGAGGGARAPLASLEIGVPLPDEKAIPVRVPGRDVVYRVDVEAAAFLPATEAAWRALAEPPPDEGVPGDEAAFEDALPGAR